MPGKGGPSTTKSSVPAWDRSAQVQTPCLIGKCRAGYDGDDGDDNDDAFK